MVRQLSLSWRVDFWQILEGRFPLGPTSAANGKERTWVRKVKQLGCKIRDILTFRCQLHMYDRIKNDELRM